jgi:hypothetical protein
MVLGSCCFAQLIPVAPRPGRRNTAAQRRQGWRGKAPETGTASVTENPPPALRISSGGPPTVHRDGIRPAIP